MKTKVYFCFAVVATLLLFASPVRSEVRLPFGDINVVVVTDVHSFIWGHSVNEVHQPPLNANYGHVLSFVERLKLLAPEKDIWFVMNGDFVHGTGLSSKVSALTSILTRMPWDALTAGDSEMADDSTIELITQPGGLIQWFGSKYVTSNVVLTSTGQPLGHRFKLLKGTSSTTLLLGFLFEGNHGSPMKSVQQVKSVIKQSWFQELSRESFDAVLVLAHMDVRHSLLDVILKGIREIKGITMPVQFITGHTHYRGYSQLDELSTSFEAGRFLDTVGFVSFPKEGNASGEFKHVFLDANTDVLADILGITAESLLTAKGDSLIGFMERTRSHLGLDEVIGCSPAHFQLNVSLFNRHSLWGLYKDKVLPTQFLQDNRNGVVIQNKATSLHYDLFKGQVTVDDVHIVSPGNESFYLVAQKIPFATIVELNSSLNDLFDANHDLPFLQKYILIGGIEDGKDYDLYTIGRDLLPVQEQLWALSPTVAMTPVKTEFGVTQLWQNFISSEWRNCSIVWDLEDDEDIENAATKKKTTMIAVTVFSIVLAFSGFAYAVVTIQKQRTNLEFDTDNRLFVRNDRDFRTNSVNLSREEGRFA